MTDFVQFLLQAWQWCDQMYLQYQAWLLPGVLVLLAVIGLALLCSEVRHSTVERRKWRRLPLPLPERKRATF